MNHFDEVITTLSQSKRVLVTTHVRPDGDALGSAGAMALGLRQKGVASEVLLLSHLPRKYAFIFEDNGIASWDVPKLVVDHHLTQEDWATTKLVRPDAAAAGEIVAELLERWGVGLDAPIAACLFLAIASDTGWFQFSNTRPHTMRLAAALMEAGADTDRMYQLLYQNERAERVALQTRALGSLELLENGRLAVMCVRKRDFEETGANVPDTENLINIPLQIRTVEASIVLTEPREPGPVRVSLRSKGGVDVARLAEPFGGGGHARAAGLKLDGPLDTAREKVVAAMLERLRAARA